MPIQSRQCQQHRHEGFSTLEVVVSLALGLLVVAGATAFQNYQLNVLRNQAEQVDKQDTTRTLVELMAREIRRAGANPGCSPSLAALEVAKENEIRIQADLDADGVISTRGEDVTYLFDSGSYRVKRVDHRPSIRSDVLVAGVNVHGSRFLYFDANGNPLDPGGDGLDQTEREAVRRVRIDVSMAEQTGNGDATTSRDLTAEADASTNLDLRNRFFVATNTWCEVAQLQQGDTVPDTGGNGGSTGSEDPSAEEEPPTCLDDGQACATDEQCCSGRCHHRHGCR